MPEAGSAADPLQLICIDADAMPLFGKSREGVREGYEPAAAALVAESLGRPLEWVFRPWVKMVAALAAGEGDAIWCGQGITEERRRRVDFTRPYAVFDESLLVRAGSGIGSPDDLAGRRIGAIAGSTNMALAETFDGAQLVPFGGESDDVFGEMIEALRAGEIDGVVDDDVAFLALLDDPGFELAFTVPTRNEWGVAVSKSRPEMRDVLDGALQDRIADGALEACWRRWMPGLEYPFAPS
jgi:polar amino acid transport system substrate-binding protein